ncbi:unnamed protein product [Brugia pahangi]|uniref:Neur_chan_LBD domain-containing protein n=1 Tax=Brugia pahangi TaxID=6280 RepID=A0A0N4TQZ5_BRUPA|nr:unnamed protein product [Brugia pahangi]
MVWKTRTEGMGMLVVGIVATLERLLVEPTGWRKDAPTLFAITRDLTDLAIWRNGITWIFSNARVDDFGSGTCIMEMVFL